MPDMSAPIKLGALVWPQYTTWAAFQGAIAVSPGVWLYQITGDGLALELTVKGTKYYKDSDLN